jgi:hypothetical protein
LVPITVKLLLQRKRNKFDPPEIRRDGLTWNRTPDEIGNSAGKGTFGINKFGSVLTE